MKKSYTKEQIFGFLMGVDRGLKVNEQCRKHKSKLDAGVVAMRMPAG